MPPEQRVSEEKTCECGCGAPVKRRFAQGHNNRHFASDESRKRRFWAKVDRSGGPDSCWLWTAANYKGYGLFTIDGRTRHAHRIAYEWEVGPIPGGRVLHHRCETPACVNPTHLEPVTNKTNVLIGNGITAKLARATHCKRGHPFTEENTYRPPSRPDGRLCRTCKRMHRRRETEADQRRRALAIFEEDGQ